MTKSELRSRLNEFLLVNFDNVENMMFHPAEYAEINGNFPYITVVMGKWTPQGVSKYGIQDISIIGIVDGDKDTLMSNLDDLQTKLIDSINKKDLKINITLIDSNNLFAPFGLDAGVYFPYAGIRVECEIGSILA